jgi:hypothetical protein
LSIIELFSHPIEFLKRSSTRRGIEFHVGWVVSTQQVDLRKADVLGRDDPAYV